MGPEEPKKPEEKKTAEPGKVEKVLQEYKRAAYRLLSETPVTRERRGPGDRAPLPPDLMPPVPESAAPPGTLAEAMNTPRWRLAWLDWANKRENAKESMEFIADADNYRGMGTRTWMELYRIINKYAPEGGENSINISGAERERLLAITQTDIAVRLQAPPAGGPPPPPAVDVLDTARAQIDGVLQGKYSQEFRWRYQ